MADRAELARVSSEQEQWVLRMREQLRAHADNALKTMIELSESSDSAAVRFQATKDILDRAGIRPPPSTQLHDVDVVVRQAELHQVDREVESLMHRLGRNQDALPAHTPDLDVLVVLEGDDEDLISADPTSGAIETTSTEE